MTRFLLWVSITMLWLGCRPLSAIREVSRDVPMSVGQSVKLDVYPVRLVSVATSGSATIELVGTGRQFKATPGEYFSGAFGPEGLQLVSSAPAKGQAVLRQRWAE
jgi:hypothetical protein